MIGIKEKRGGRRLQSFVVFSFFLFFLSSVVSWNDNWEWHDQQRFFQIVLLCVVLASSCFLRFSGFPRWVSASLALVFFVGAVSSINAAYPIWAFVEWGRYVALCVLVMQVSLWAGSPKCRDFFIFSIAVLAGLSAYQFLVFYVIDFLSGIRSLDIDKLFYGFSNPRFLGQFQVLFVPVLGFLFIRAFRERGQWSVSMMAALALVLSVQWCMIFGLGGRGVWASLIVSHVALAVMVARCRALLYVQLIFVFIGATLFFLLFYAVTDPADNNPVLRETLRSGLSSRGVIWELAWKMSLDHPLLGVGPMHFAAEVNRVAAHPHQAVLQWAAEWGWPVTLLLISMVLYGVLKSLRLIRLDNEADLKAALWLSITSALILSLVDGVFFMPYTEVCLAILIGIALNEFGVKMPPQRSTIYACRAMSIPIVFLFIYVLVAGVGTLGDAKFDSVSRSQPRFWSHGWIP